MKEGAKLGESARTAEPDPVQNPSGGSGYASISLGQRGFILASPQKENGYVPIANEIIEHLARFLINGETMRVLWVIFRKTYGFNKKEDAISLSQFVEATGMKKPEVCRALRKLESMKIIGKTANAVANKYVFIKNYDLWKPLAKQPTLAKSPTSVGRIAKKRWQNSHIQKTVSKDTITKDIEPQAALIGELIKSFEGMNPNTKSLYGRPPQRKASLNLIETHGLERAKKAIAYVEANRDDRFCPSITTPIQLQEKWAQLEDYGRKKNSKIKKVIL